ncbi:S8 family serine peptidase [Ohtaekwangia koreensis]|uniref:Por secretion system C-terminal sorting domain-containing protein n=1 Tax=Ohtaekwangia koreensis TaxID=688867 RepID=A0A1T5MHI1_9BACT|nr:S8 family serine peptidase [Ohtaekwangia koreensis]SKC87706.1 Por secretion system C-terminal sorting domain-containing protein [Ohtaekwangia koreensis]
MNVYYIIKRLVVSIALIFIYSTIYSQNKLQHILVKASREEINELQRTHAIKFARALPSGDYVCFFNENAQGRERLRGEYINDNRWKLAPAFTKTDITGNILSVQVVDVYVFKQYIREHISRCEILNEHAASNTILLRLNAENDLDILLECDVVVFIGISPEEIIEETSNSFQDIGVNKVNIVHNIYHELSGEGLNVCIKERSFDTTDIDLAGRAFTSMLTDEERSLHAAQMATIIAGGGNSIPASKGAAWASRITASSFSNLLPDDGATLSSLGISVQNHSYGVSVDNIYGAEAHAYDVSVNNNSELLHIFSAGNSGSTVSTSGTYAGIAGYANLSGNMKMAKNVLTVSATDKTREVSTLNSRGPAYDGRLKPELVAFGSEGTSDAAAMVSGISILVQHAYKNIYSQLPSAALVKAILIASADDVENRGIDFISGYGAVNAYQAIQLVKAAFFKNDNIGQNETKTMDIHIPSGIKTLRVAVTWNDPAAAAGDAIAIVNDLDGKLTNGNLQWHPWVLSHYPHADSLSKAAIRKPDHLNTVEYITVDDPAAGTYQLQVTSKNLATDTQDFHVAYWLDTANVFQWTYPTGSDKTEAESEIYFRWNSSFEDTGTLEVSVNGSPYETIAENIAIADDAYTWKTPAGLGVAVARMKIGNDYYRSDTFTIAPSIPLKVGYNCDDEVLLTWNKIPGATQYRVLSMQGKYMEPIYISADTSFIFDKDQFASLYYAIQPVIDNKVALQGVAYNYSDQGVHCYYRNFIAMLTEAETAKLSLNISTVYNVTGIQFEKEIDGSFTPLDVVPVNSNLLYEYIDESIRGGVIRYRAAILLSDGRAVYSDTSVLYYGDDKTYLVYPNPVKAEEQELEVLTNGDNLKMVLYDMTGKILKSQDLYNSLFRFSIAELTRGFYIYRIFRNSKPVASGRLVVN